MNEMSTSLDDDTEIYSRMSRAVKKVNIIYKPSLEIKKALKSFRFRIIR